MRPPWVNGGGGGPRGIRPSLERSAGARLQKKGEKLNEYCTLYISMRERCPTPACHVFCRCLGRARRRPSEGCPTMRWPWPTRALRAMRLAATAEAFLRRSRPYLDAPVRRERTRARRRSERKWWPRSPAAGRSPPSPRGQDRRESPAWARAAVVRESSTPSSRKTAGKSPPVVAYEALGAVAAVAAAGGGDGFG
jgi:hypothetical protein